MERRTLSELRAGDPVRVGDVTIVPLEERHVTVGGEQHRVVAGADQRAVGIVIVDAAGARALDLAGRPLDLDALLERAAGLRKVL